jgi:hypothetical protein
MTTGFQIFPPNSIKAWLIWFAVLAMFLGWLRPWKAKSWKGTYFSRGVGGYAFFPAFGCYSIECVYETTKDGRVFYRMIQCDTEAIWHQRANAEEQAKDPAAKSSY